MAMMSSPEPRELRSCNALALCLVLMWELGEKRKKRWANFQGFKGGWEPSSREQAIPQLISLYKSIGVSILDMMAL
ncbi:hypothetical protein NC652_013411 [Populus alba x Populus x berolinensis]|uniref:Uncharacterized protein n=1 Tax=Populus alba x Populus x berolinensis TaxID=444605 RepID=A0AAD6QUG4_9ROSI|nr:hypothetical protein NC652_013411 [Populus alba x Populus x berolinensis]KAJ6996763.1 hypothetical protein NC653_013380 [Populus alba x Populus x berolinensis]